MQIERGTFCPLVKEDCKQFECVFWTKLMGKDPQSEQHIDEWDCAVRWLPILLIEGSQESRQTAAAVESLRNVVAKQAEQLPSIAIPNRQARLGELEQ